MLCQYMDPHRKMAFGNLGVYGVEGNYEVKGCFAWRGAGVPQYFADIASFEFYDKEPIDPNNEEGRNRLKAYWLHTQQGDKVEDLPLCNNIWFK